MEEEHACREQRRGPALHRSERRLFDKAKRDGVHEKSVRDMACEAQTVEDGCREPE